MVSVPDPPEDPVIAELVGRVAAVSRSVAAEFMALGYGDDYRLEVEAMLNLAFAHLEEAGKVLEAMRGRAWAAESVRDWADLFGADPPAGGGGRTH